MRYYSEEYGKKFKALGISPYLNEEDLLTNLPTHITKSAIKYPSVYPREKLIELAFKWRYRIYEAMISVDKLPDMIDGVMKYFPIKVLLRIAKKRDIKISPRATREVIWSMIRNVLVARMKEQIQGDLSDLADTLLTAYFQFRNEGEAWDIIANAWITNRFHFGASGIEDLADSYASQFRAYHPGGSLDISGYNIDLAKSRLIDQWNTFIEEYARGDQTNETCL